MRHIASIICVLGILVSGVLPVSAVTDKEMEEARTIAAQAYLRYANDGSGYLDEVRPTTMAGLTKVLKEKERENLKSFQSVAVPKDYASWDKAKLVEYWSETFFKSPGLIDKGKIGKSRVKARVSRMTVAPPAKPAAVSDETTKGAEAIAAANDVKPANAEGAPARKDSVGDAQAVSNARKGEMERMTAVADSVAALEEAEAELMETAVEKRKDSTWIYVLILCVLVAIVVALVIFASSTMKSQNAGADVSPEERNRKLAEADEMRAAARAAAAEQEARYMAEREKMSAEKEDLCVELTRKDEQIASLTAHCDRLTVQCEALRARVAALQDTIEGMSAKVVSETASSTSDDHTANVKGVSKPVEDSVSVHRVPKSVVPEAVTAPRPADAPAVTTSKIYLGRVNSRGVFVRADRSLNIEGSVYVLETEDGYSGSFRVVRNRKVWERLVSNPGHWLDGGCTTRESGDADFDAVVTESAGTAIFEDSCWRMIRKARIRFE